MNSVQKFWYDANGNMVCRIDEQDRHWRLTWTAENQLKQAVRYGGTYCSTGSGSPQQTLAYSYDADGMMVQRTENGQTTNRLGKLFEHNVTNVTLGSFTKYYQFGGRLIAMRQGLSSGSSVSFFATDHLGSTAVTIWASGNVRARLRHKPWGEQRYAQYATPTGYRYTGQRWDSGLGLYDYNARYYDPHIGKFISADTLCWGAVFIWLLGHGLETSHSSQRKTAPELQRKVTHPRYGPLTVDKCQVYGSVCNG